MSPKNQECQTDSSFFDFERARSFRSKGKFTDVVIQSTADDNKNFIKCHRVILATVSPFFEDKLGKGIISNLSIPEVDHETLEILIEYMYGGGGLINLNAENVFKLCTGAKHFKLPQLVSSCLEFMRSLVTFKDVIQIFKFSLADNILGLKETCMNFIIKNLEKIKTFGLLDLDFEQVQILVEHGIQNQTVSMSDILEAVSGWLHANTGERLEHAFSLINKIPLSKIDVKILRRLIREDELLNNIPKVYSLYVDAVEEMGLQFQQAQIEKRKDEELDNAMEEVVVLYDYTLNQPGSSKRGRFSTANESNKTNESSDGDIRNDIGWVKKTFEPTLTSIKRNENPVVYFVAKSIASLGFKNSIVSFSLKTKKVSIVGPNMDLSNSRIVYHKHKIYCLGGVKIRMGVQWNPVAVLDVSSKLWEENAPDHVDVRTGFKTVVLDDYLYTVGGLAHAGDCCEVERLKIQKPYEPWEAVAKLPFSRCGFGICVSKGCIYVIGGNTYVHSELATTNNGVICYSPESNEWVNKAHMPIFKQGFAVAVVGRYIYVLGGSKSASFQDEKLSGVDIYDTELDSWKEGISMNKNRQFFSAIVFNNCIYALGGDSGDSPTMEMFSIERQVWEDMGPLPVFGHYHNVDFDIEEL